MQLNTIYLKDFSGKRVLVRVDFNVPLESGAVADDTRIRAVLPTLSQLLGSGASLVLCSHLGRPEGRFNADLRLAPIAPVLEQLLNEHLAENGITRRRVVAVNACVGEEAQTAIGQAADLDVFLLENLRFHEGETMNDPAFAGQLAELADVYVSDAFGTVHRAHASTEGVAHLLPAYAGLLVEKEVAALSKISHNPRHPLVILLGGAKISGKIEVLEALLPKADNVLIGGAMANTFMKAIGRETGTSLVEDDMLDTAIRMLKLASKSSAELLLPEDFVVAKYVKNPSTARMADAASIGKNEAIVDIGAVTRREFGERISRADTVFWNGPMGIFEVDEYAQGTLAMAHALAAVKDKAVTVVGGGESVAAVHKAGVAADIHHVSTGGGASLEFIAGKELPGLKVLELRE
jgi:phosphoglycerate kinase